MLDILVVDEEASNRMGVACALAGVGHRVVEAADGVEALKLLQEGVFDLMIADAALPKLGGLALLRRLRQEWPSIVVILMAAHGRIADAVTAIREGAFDYVTKPFDPGEVLLPSVERIAERRSAELSMRESLSTPDKANGSAIVGRSAIMVRLIERVDTLARSDAPVLITGESGTGKELIARAIHLRGPRRARPFIAVNCAALPESLLEAELFGHDRGAFTGAVRKRAGRFAIADGGTLLLDEIAEISPSAQTKLLRVLEEGVFEPLGSDRSVRVDVRIISATHQDLKARISDGRFREDLYYRLNVLDAVVPPLRERREDLPLLLTHFLKRFAPADGVPSRVSADAWLRLSKYPFPGNVREFAHVIQRAAVLALEGEITVEHLPAEVTGGAPALAPILAEDFDSLALATAEFERQYLLQALALTGGQRTRAAQLLGISRKCLWEKLRIHGVAVSDAALEPAAAPPGNAPGAPVTGR